MSQSKPVIGTPTRTDIDRLVTFFLADMRELGARPDRDAMRKATTRMLDDPHTYLRVARVGGAIGGVLLANEFWSIKFPGRALWIEELYVDPEFRRMGIAKALVDDFLDWAHAEGFVGVELEAYRMNTAASILYRSLGFRRLARERYSFDMSEYELEGDDE